MITEKRQLQLWLNGKEIVEKHPNPEESLISFVRRHGYTGTKLGCAEGGCGSCTVMISFYDRETRKVEHQSVNSCLYPAVAADGKSVTTVEGIGSVENMHPVQEKISNSYGSQCGFCTPGIIMAVYTTLKNNPNISAHDLEESLDGNLCRCTGYRSILDGAKSLTVKYCKESCAVNGVCKSESTDCNHPKSVENMPDMEDMVQGKDSSINDTILKQGSIPPKAYFFDCGSTRWFKPTQLSELLDILEEHPKAKIINGNSEVGIETRFKNQVYPVLVYPTEVQELLCLDVKEEGLEVGSAVTISRLQKFLKDVSQDLPEYKTRSLQAVLENIRWFAGTHVRNAAAIGGNIVTASPISDLNPVFVALGSILTVTSKSGGSRKISMREFFLGYRKTALNPSEVVVSIYIPFSTSSQFIKAYKQAKRKDDDIAIVNACMNVTFSEDLQTISDACLSYGGMGPTTMIAKTTNAALIGKQWSPDLPEQIPKLILNDLPLSATAPGGQIEFRKLLATSFFAKFHLFVSSQLPHFKDQVHARETSAIEDIKRGESTGQQEFVEAASSEIVGRSLKHTSADKQVTGAAVYIDDIPKFANELAVALVGSTVAHGRILSVDPSEALKLPGVVGYVNYKDVPHVGEDHGHGDPNMIGPVVHDEELFATEFVHFYGQPIGLIVADSETVAFKASKLVRVEYEMLQPIFTIEEAIEKQSFFSVGRQLKSGVFAKNEELNTEGVTFIKGEVRMAGQEHFYLETQASIVVPKKEDNEIEVFASTQHPTETQHMVAHVLGIPSNRVLVRVKRMGGGFGGKESRSVFLTCLLGVAAKKYGRPTRLMLSREEDMAISGTRHPFLGKYKVGAFPDGRLHSLELEVFSNGGYSLDLSTPVLERSMTHSDNVYNIPHVKIIGRICKTNLPTNTAFRGFGGPQGLMIAEQWMQHLSDALQLPVDDIRRINFYKDGDVSHFSMPLEDFHFERVWWELIATSDYHHRKEEVDKFNQANKYRKRGIALLPTKFGISFTARFMNQAGALVHVYTDGSVLITHGGTEMGQGLHTKMVQIAAQAFNIPVTMVHLSETSTNTVANTSATAASASSDLNGMAVLDACTQILNRLKPFREANPTKSWTDIVKMAYFERVNLSANGFYKTPDLSYDWEKNTGRMFAYFTYGAACAEVEVDTLTGDHTVKRADVVMDIGTPINPSIDVGQIEGAFAQGMGWSTLEEPLISPSTGFLFTRGPGGYKIPGFRDVPEDFRIRVVKGSRNVRAIHSSKAVGEPPLFMGASVFFAIREAVKAARIENGHSGHFRFDSPATSERIRTICGDPLTEIAATPLKPGEKPFSVSP